MNVFPTKYEIQHLFMCISYDRQEGIFQKKERKERPERDSKKSLNLIHLKSPGLWRKLPRERKRKEERRKIYMIREEKGVYTERGR
jgi:hypothetical protein